MEIEEHKVHVEEVPIRYLSVGSGPALLLLHGIGDSISDWKPVMRELSDAWSIFALRCPLPPDGAMGGIIRRSTSAGLSCRS